MKKVLLLITLSFILFFSASTVYAREIGGNGTGGIYIDINKAPYTYSAYVDGRDISYSNVGCTWFAMARALELTGKINYFNGSMTVYGGYKWWFENDAANIFSATKGTTPQAPAVIAWDGHVAILEKIEGSTAYISEGGYWKDNNTGYTNISAVNVNDIKTYAKDENDNSRTFYGYIYLKPQWYSYLTLNDIGEIAYGQLIINKPWKNIIDVGSKPQIGNLTSGEVDHVWIFRKQEDGSYTIQNAKSKLYLDVQNFNDYDNAPVNTAGYNNTTAQKWFIYGPGSGSYMLRPASSTERVLTVNGSNQVGDKLVLSTHKDNDYQRFAIWTMPGVGNATVSYSLGSNKTTFTWTKASDATKYNIWIGTGSAGNTTTYKEVVGVTDLSYSISLPKGYYEMVVMPTNGYSFTTSNTVKFAVSQDQTVTTKKISDCAYYYNDTLIIDGAITTIFDYTGKQITPKIVLKYGNATLTAGVDYTLEYKTNINPGTGQIYFYGKGNYSGSWGVLFKIQKGNISNVEVSNIPNKTYLGKSITPNSYIKLNGITLTKNVDYKLTYTNNVNVGTATMTITGIGNYTGSKSINFKIVAVSGIKVKYPTITNQTYTGSQIKPNIELKYGNVILKQGTDYSITYGVNKEVGIGRVKITFKGNYTGTRILTFVIVPTSPTITSARNPKTKVARIYYSESVGATGYQIAYRERGSSKWNYTRTTALYRNITNLNINKYEIKVRAYSTINGSNYYGTWSASKVVTIR